MAIGWAAILVPYLWVLTDLWNSGPSMLRSVLPHGLLSNFYDLQGRAILSGHLYVANGALGQEAFVHNGHQYTYFGIFPSLLRLPILAATHALDGRLTAISIFIAWVATGLLTAAILWRCRLAIRGPIAMGAAEAVTYGLAFTAVVGGSALINLAANPWVYSEDIAWSTALSLTALMCTLRVVEHPSWGRVALLALAVLAVNLTRGTVGIGWSIGMVLLGLWLGWGRNRARTRKYSLPTVAVGIGAWAVSAAVSWLKFGVVSGYPLQDQVWFSSHHLGSLNHGHYFSLVFLPTGLKTYLASLGVHFSSVFPFITLPLYPAHPVGHVTLFGAEQVTSVPGSMPLLFVLSILGVVAVLRPSSPMAVRMFGLPLLATAVPGAALLFFGFLDNRFVGDFVPFLVLASALGVAALWRVLGTTAKSVRWTAVSAIALLCLYGVAANFGMAMVPTGWWSERQAAAFVSAQQHVGNVIGSPVSSAVVHRKTLPSSGPLGQIVVIGDCRSVFFAPSTGLQSWIRVDHHATKAGVRCGSLIGSPPSPTGT